MRSHMSRTARAAATVAVGALAVAGLAMPAHASGEQKEGPSGQPAVAVGAVGSAAAVSRFQLLTPGTSAARSAQGTSGATPESIARAFLASPRSQVNAPDASTELVLNSVQPSAANGTVVRFGQQVDGVPVFGGEVLVDLAESGDVRSAASESLPGPAPDAKAAITPAQASATALAAVARSTGTPAASLHASVAQQWIFDPRILGMSGAAQASLVWRTEVTGTAGRSVNRLVLVDANTGTVTLDLDQIENARNRQVCDANHTSAQVPCIDPARTEGSSPSAIADLDAAYDFSGDTYDFYFSRFGRDSIDNQGMALLSTVRYCEGYSCPFENAYWDGLQMVYGDGYAIDDVVAHELTHGVTEHMSDLIYYGQSGAINESLSDTFGEFVDLTNSGGNDTPSARWQLGEDLPGYGAIRNMADPTLFNDPDRMGSPLYYAGSSDGAGVHTNSGVGNKLAYLLTDGGTFNGRTITGLGLTKAPLIIYWAANLLTSSSDYEAYGHALQASCASLVGTSGITQADCLQVETAAHAVEILPVSTAPLAPGVPSVRPGNGQVTMTWQPPADGLSPITDYLVQYSTDGGSSWSTFPDGVSTATAVTVTGLTNDVGHLFRVAAVNAVGTGDYSSPTSAVTPSASLPTTAVISYSGAPIAVPDNDGAGAHADIAVPSGIGSVSRVTATVVRLDMTYDDDLSLSLISPQGTEVVLSNRNGGSGDNYIETLFDDNAVQPITDGVAPFTGAFRPQTPLATFNGENSTGVWRLRVVDSSSGDTASIVAWRVMIWGPTPQTIDFAQPVNTSVTAGAVDLSATATSGLPVTFTTATPAVCTIAGARAALVSAGTCSIRASQTGNSQWGPAPVVTRSFQVTPVVPGAPTNLRVAMFPAARQAAITWTPPVKTGGTPLSGYRLRVSAPNSATVFTPWTSTSATTRLLTGLINGATYRVQVAAVTSAGTSQVTTLAFRQPTVATSVRDLRVASMPAAGRATIAWNPPASNGGTPVVRYLLRVSAPNSTSYGPWVANTTTSRTLVNLRKSSVYRVQVIAVNSQGNSAPVTLSFRQAR